MPRAALNGDLEQPTGNAFARVTVLRDAAQLPGHVRNIAQLVGERRRERLLVQFHDIDGRLPLKPHTQQTSIRLIGQSGANILGIMHI